MGWAAITSRRATSVEEGRAATLVLVDDSRDKPGKLTERPFSYALGDVPRELAAVEREGPIVVDAAREPAEGARAHVRAHRGIRQRQRPAGVDPARDVERTLRTSGWKSGLNT